MPAYYIDQPNILNHLDENCGYPEFEMSFIKTFVRLVFSVSFEPLPIDIIVNYIQPLDESFEMQEIYLLIKHCFLDNESVMSSIRNNNVAMSVYIVWSLRQSAMRLQEKNLPYFIV